MGKPKHKQPSFNESLRDFRKQPGATENPDAWRESHPAWRFSRCDFDGCVWSWSNVDGPSLVSILTRLKELETRTWKEILLDKSNGSIEVSHERIASDAKARIASNYSDIDTIWKLRVTQAGRVWGTRVGHVLHIMWWDPEHSVYPMNLTGN